MYQEPILHYTFGNSSAIYRTFWTIENQDGDQWDGEDFTCWWNENPMQFEDDDNNLFIHFQKAMHKAKERGDLELKVIENDEFWNDDLPNEWKVIRYVKVEA